MSAKFGNLGGMTAESAPENNTVKTGSIESLSVRTGLNASKTGLTKAASSLRLYDTATHSITDFRPVKAGEVSMYVCGATVQSAPHVGHLRAAVAFDVVRRWLLKLGYNVTFVRNVTDIDDKILDKAAAESQKWWARAYCYEREFTRAYDTLGVIAPTYEPRATGHVPQMIELVNRLIERGHAYAVENPDGTPSGNVYFDVPSWEKYGSLTHQQEGTKPADEAAMTADRMGPGIDSAGDDKYNPADAADLSEDKHDPRDFALWKASKESDPEDARWQTPFGTGRPGWHLECSVMSHRYLGDDFDIHGGGLDLRFPHHENEMAQSQAAGYGFAHRWMHSAWVTAKGEKMSKSLGTGLSVDTVLENYSAWEIRYAIASVQYRSMLEWSDRSLKEARAAYTRIANFLSRAKSVLGDDMYPSYVQIAAVDADSLPKAFVSAMNDDISVSGALAAVFSAIRSGNAVADTIASGKADPKSAETESLRARLCTAVKDVRAMLDVFGLDPEADNAVSVSVGNKQSGLADSAAIESGSGSAAEKLSSLIKEIADIRKAERAAKRFDIADKLRDILKNAGHSDSDAKA